MFGKEEVKVFLKEKRIPFRWVEHKAVYTIEEMEELGLEKMEETAKNLFLRDQKGKNHFLVVIRADKQANLKELGEKQMCIRDRSHRAHGIGACGGRKQAVFRRFGKAEAAGRNACGELCEKGAEGCFRFGGGEKNAFDGTRGEKADGR